MKKLFIALFSLIACSLLFVGCGEKDETEPLPNDGVIYIDNEELYFASGCDYTLIEQYFKEHGIGDSSYTIATSTDKGVYSTSNAIEFTPKDKEFVIASTYTKNGSNTIVGSVEQYMYTGIIKIKLNQPLTEAKYSGQYEFQAVGITSDKSVYYSANFTFGNIRYITPTQTASFEDISSTGQISYASDYPSATKAFERDKNTVAQTCYDRINGCLIALQNLFQEIDNDYKIAGKFISPDECEHVAVTDKGYEATCLSEGMTDGSHCKICNTVLKKKEEIPAKGHTPVTDKRIPSTCTESGLTEGSHCSVCDTVLTEQEIIPAGHIYADRECTVCHKPEPSEGLEFSSSYISEYGFCYAVTGIGTCSDSYLVVPDTYNDLPVRTIGSNAFKGNTLLIKAFIPEKIVCIQTNAFYGCTNLNEIILPETLESIGSNAFHNTGYYNDSANWDGNVLYANDYLIKAKEELTGTYEIKNGTALIADQAFFQCKNLTSVHVPDSVLYIGDSAFYSCTALTSVQLSNKLLSIGAHAFEHCKLNSVSLPKSLQYIGYDALLGIKTIDYGGTVSDWKNINKNNGSFEGTTIICSNGTV